MEALQGGCVVGCVLGCELWSSVDAARELRLLQLGRGGPPASSLQHFRFAVHRLPAAAAEPTSHPGTQPITPFSFPPLVACSSLQVIGQAMGNAAMILASGKKGYRYALPNARIMTCPPRMNRCDEGVVWCVVVGYGRWRRDAGECTQRWDGALMQGMVRVGKTRRAWHVRLAARAVCGAVGGHGREVRSWVCCFHLATACLAKSGITGCLLQHVRCPRTLLHFITS